MDLLAIGIVGAVASVLTQIIKGKVEPGLPTAIVAIIVALVLGGIAYLLNFLPDLKEALLGVLILSNIAYGMVIKHIIPIEEEE